MSTSLQDLSGNTVNADATSHGLVVQNPKTLAQIGYVGLAGVNDTGSVVAGGDVNPVYVTQGEASGGIYSASKNLLWDDTFNATAQNTAKYKCAFTGYTITDAAGFLQLNGAGTTTASQSAGYQTWKNFPLFAKAELRINVSAQIPNGAQTNQTIEYGLFNATLNGAAPGAPTDGVFFRWNTVGELRGYVNYNGTETSTAAMAPPSNSINHDWLIIVNTNTVQFYIDGVLYGSINLLSAAPLQGQPFMAASMPITFRVFSAASTPAAAPILKVSDIFVSELGPDLARPWAHQKAGFGHMLYQGQNGGTMGSASNYTNSLAPGAGAALSNTAALVTALGGQCAFTPTLAANTDGILCSFQNPVGSVNQTPRNIFITGVRIQSVVTTSITSAGPIILLHALCFGHSAVSLATAESASFTSSTTKAPRRVVLGMESFPLNATIGQVSSAPNGVYMAFNSPILVSPSEFLAISTKNSGTVSTAGVITSFVTFDGYLE